MVHLGKRWLPMDPTVSRQPLALKWKIRLKIFFQSGGMKSIGLQARRCETPSGTHEPAKSKLKSATIGGNFDCGFGTTEEGLIHNFFAQMAYPNTGVPGLKCASE